MLHRRALDIIKKDLGKKMVLLSGPRQCGKTTLSVQLAETMASFRSFNWDVAPDRKQLLALELPLDASLWIFDELHKYRGWRNWLKGVYDQWGKKHSILVTGSAKLEIYSRGGDSLQGRYFPHRLHPITFSEYLQIPDPAAEGLWNLENHSSKSGKKSIGELMRLGGFPEPLLSGSEVEADRWRFGYGTRLVREEVRSLEQVQNLDTMEVLFDRLPDTVGSVLSINSLREDLEVGFATAKKWIQIFERLYGVFRVYPCGSAKIKAVKKEAKLYFWDWARVSHEGKRFENLVAVHLLRLCHWMEDVWGVKCELRYFRTVLGHEVDFILLRKGQPWVAIEVKRSDEGVDTNLVHLLERMRIPYAFQVTLSGSKDFETNPIQGTPIRIVPADRFLGGLP